MMWLILQMAIGLAVALAGLYAVSVMRRARSEELRRNDERMSEARMLAYEALIDAQARRVHRAEHPTLWDQWLRTPNGRADRPIYRQQRTLDPQRELERDVMRDPAEWVAEAEAAAERQWKEENR